MLYIVFFSKNNVSLRRETRINIALNTEDLTCLLATVRTLKRKIQKSGQIDQDQLKVTPSGICRNNKIIHLPPQVVYEKKVE